jgi:hypothetical protein
MAAETMTDEDVRVAQERWKEYQASHDVSALRGQAAGIDPHSGRIWFGDDMVEVVDAMKSDGIHVPLYFVRVGYDYFYRKGGRR